MTFDYTYLGSLLKDARESVNMKQSEVSDLIGCTSSNISSWERGKSKIDIESLVLLCNIYQINFNELMHKVQNQRFSDFSNFEKEIIKKYRTLDEYGQEAVDTILEVEHRRCTDINASHKILSLTAARSEDNRPVTQEHIKDLSKVEPDDSDL